MCRDSEVVPLSDSKAPCANRQDDLCPHSYNIAPPGDNQAAAQRVIRTNRMVRVVPDCSSPVDLR
jgi:hypothetical protein